MQRHCNGICATGFEPVSTHPFPSILHSPCCHFARGDPPDRRAQAPQSVFFVAVSSKSTSTTGLLVLAEEKPPRFRFSESGCRTTKNGRFFRMASGHSSQRTAHRPAQRKTLRHIQNGTSSNSDRYWQHCQVREGADMVAGTRVRGWLARVLSLCPDCWRPRVVWL
jgi:hypothetical protein